MPPPIAVTKAKTNTPKGSSFFHSQESTGYGKCNGTQYIDYMQKVCGHGLIELNNPVCNKQDRINRHYFPEIIYTSLSFSLSFLSIRNDTLQITPYDFIFPPFTCAFISFTHTESILRTVLEVSFTACFTASSKLFLRKR